MSSPPAQNSAPPYAQPQFANATPHYDPQVPSSPAGGYAPAAHAAPAAVGAPEKSRSGILIIGLITAVTALVIVAAGFAVVFINSGNDDKPNTAAPKPSAPAESRLPAQTAAPSPTPSRSPLPSTTPTIRSDVRTVSVVGPTWQNEDKIQLMDLAGWPFAFRLPEGWSCLRGSIDALPDAQAWGCVKTDGEKHQQKFNIMLRRCPTGCTATEQQTMNEAWFDDDEEPNLKKADATTTYVEIPKNKDGFYAVDFSHFFADKPGGALTYQVGVWFQSPDKYKEEMQKSLNDVRTQAPQPN
ncbi:hypothetical protein FL583_32030 [Cryptosporangium phraense]|uniref:Uncharacterized protein n=2 Tax=Cryptosporangium phraense TaxID=2593070 RepID=A0A545AI62_9ACTN|nr:hypothetical protein FL583_32030 [Cryptosporangium phraense]